MPNRFENRRSLLLAALLALLAAGTLCVWGVAAAGLSINSPALEAAIQAFNETRAQDAQGDGSGNGDVNISDPGDGTIPDGNGGDDDGGDTGGGDGDTGGNGDSGNGSSNCLLGILCLNVDADVDANLGDQPGGLNIGGLHIDANANANDDVIADVDVDANAASQDGSRCFLNLICLTARADADLATNEALDLDAIVDVDADVDDDIHADVDVDADLARSNSPANPGLLDGLLDLFIDVN